MQMSSRDLMAWIGIAAVWVNVGALLWLQARALSRHRQICFALLCGSSICVGLYEFCRVVVPYLYPPHSSAPLWYHPLMLMLLLSSIVLGLWGTVRLFRIYGILAATVDSTHKPLVK